MTTATVYVALGTNLGDRRANLSEAIRQVKQKVRIERLSSIYETEAAYITDQPQFLNMALRGAVDADELPPRELLQFLKDIEGRMGREHLVRYGPRLIDLDILAYGDVRMDEANLVIPHPRAVERDFVLAPLAEIAPDLLLPGQTETISVLAQRLPGIGKVIRTEEPLRFE
jgi:2-amino-4-hydroxy-6-hydroxymethyldihydropteridine diphosphokinase